MRVIPISDEDLAKFPDGAQTRVFSAPGGDLTDPVIPPAEGIMYRNQVTGLPPDQTWPVVAVIIQLDDDDREAIAAGGRIVMGWPGESMPVFMLPWVLP